jgi:MFS family permease
MSHGTSWRPAPRAGLVPLYPFGFGTALGRAFSALRGNPRVLLGFAVGVQTVASIVAVLLIGLVTWLAFSRLDTVEQYTDEYDAIAAGSVAIVVVVSIAVSLALTALSVIVQGVVVAEVSRAVVGERASLRELWALVRPAFWRLTGYFVLQLLAVLLVGAVIAVPFVAAITTEQWGLMAIAIPALLAVLPLWAWLGTKLYYVPSAIVLERARPFRAIARSWILTRGRFWPTFGVMILISVIMGVASSVVGIPLQLVSTLLPSILMPFGESTVDAGPAVALVIAVAVLSAALQLLISAISTIVSATGAALMYVDARMRREALDLRLQAYVEQRELGAGALPDPWAYDPSFATYAAQPRYAAPPAYAAAPQGYPGQPAPGQYPAYPAPPSHTAPAPQYPAYPPQYQAQPPQYPAQPPQEGQAPPSAPPYPPSPPSGS